MKVGDVVRVNKADPRWGWGGQVGVIIASAKRLHIPAFKVMLTDGVFEFDYDELKLVR